MKPTVCAGGRTVSCVIEYSDSWFNSFVAMDLFYLICFNENPIFVAHFFRQEITRYLSVSLRDTCLEIWVCNLSDLIYLFIGLFTVRMKQKPL